MFAGKEDFQGLSNERGRGKCSRANQEKDAFTRI